MIRITSTTSKKNENTKIKSKKKTLPVKDKSGSFDITLQETISFDFPGAIEELLHELKDEEKRFLAKQSLYELNRYKAIVQKILKKILEEGQQTQTLKRLRRDKADFIIVQKVNSKLLDIAEQITNKTNKAFNLLKAIEEIRGLIFDLVY